MEGNIIGTVLSVQGVIQVQGLDGQVRTLAAGDSIREGEIITTNAGAMAVVQMADGSQVTLNPGEAVTMTAEMSSDIAPGADEAEVASVDPLVQAVLGEGNLDELLEAPAAGNAEQANDGHSFVQLARVFETTGTPGGVSTAGAGRGFVGDDPGVQLVADAPVDLTPEPQPEPEPEPQPQPEPEPEPQPEPEPEPQPEPPPPPPPPPPAANQAPVAVDDPVTTDEDQPVDINVLGNDADPDGDPLEVVDFTQPGNGSVTLNDDGTFTYTPDQDFNGTDEFDYTISDGNGGTSTATVTITVTPVNDPPVPDDDNPDDNNAVGANPDLLTTPEDTPLDIDPDVLLGNDVDVDGDTLTIVDVDSDAVDGDGEVVGTVTTTVVDGVVTSITFTPNADYNGSAFFDYTVSDGTDEATATVTVDVTPVNDPPVPDDDNPDDNNAVGADPDLLTTPEDTPLDIDPAVLLSNDVDVDGDTLTIVDVDANAVDGDGEVVGTVTTTVVDGVVTSITFTPNADYNGSAFFDYTVSDGTDEADATVTVVVTPAANGDPVVGMAETVVVSEEGLLGGNPDEVGVPSDQTNSATTNLGSIPVSDPDGDPLTFSLDGPDGLTSNGEPITWSFSGGTLTGSTTSGPVMTVVLGSVVAGELGYSVNLLAQIDHAAPEAPATSEENVRDITFTLTANDGQGGQTEGSFVVRVEDDSPVASVTDGIAVNAAGTIVNGLIAEIGADHEGATVTFDGTQAPPTGLTSGGVAVTYSVAGSVLTASAGGAPVFTLTLDDDGSYQFEQLAALDLFVERNILQNVVDAGGPQPTYYYFENGTFSSETDGNGPYLLSVSSPGGVNPSNAGIGVGGNNFVTGSVLTFNLDNEGISGAADQVSSIALLFDSNGGPALSVSETIDYVINAVSLDGLTTQQVSGSFSGADLVDGVLTFSAPPGLILDSVVLTAGPDTSVKIDGVSIFVRDNNVDETLGFNVAVQDGDGDTLNDIPLTVALQNPTTVDGTAGNDALGGSTGNDILTGAGGNDILTGGLGSDTFVWSLADAGAVGSPAVDRVTDFNAADGDKLAFGDLLPDGANAETLAGYLDFSFDGTDTTINVKDGVDGEVVQTVVLEGVDLTTAGTDAQIIQSLMDSGNLGNV